MDWTKHLILFTVPMVLSCHSGSPLFNTRSVGGDHLGSETQRTSASRRVESQPLLLRLNFPGERFTANHGIHLEKGQKKNFLFVVDRSDVTYMAIGASIDHEDGQPQKYKLYMSEKHQVSALDPATLHSTLTASDSYTHAVRYSRELVVQRPSMGSYFVVVEAVDSFSDMLITAVMDYPEAPASAT